MATQFDPTQYFLGSGLGVGRFNQPYRPKIQDILARMNRPEITGMPGQGVYIDQMSYPQYVSRTGPDIFYQKRRDPLGANLYPNVPGMGFTPSAGLMDMGGEMQPMYSESEEGQIAAAGARFKTPNELGFMPGGSRDPVVIEDRMAQDNPNYRAEPAQEAGAAPRRTLGLLGDMFGGASALDEYMTPEQRAQLQNQGVMAAAMQLLASSGPSRVPVGLGQALGQAYGAGQQGYTAAQQNLLQSMTAKQKMDEAKAAKNMQAEVANFMAQPAPEGVDANTFKAQQYMKLADIYAASNPEQASKFFDMAQKLMPVSAKPEGKPEQKLVNGEVKMVQYYNDGTFKVVSGLGEVAKPEGQPRMEMRGGQPKMVQYFNDGTSKVIEGASQYNAPSTSITDLEILTGQPLAGTGAAGVAQVQDYRKSGAGGGTTVSVNTGEKVRVGEINKDITEEMRNVTAQARSANETLMNVDRILPALDKAITGPLADYRTTLTRVGQQFGIVGKDANEILAKTQTLVQGLAQQELAAAGQMRGQGAITEAERALLRRAAVGDQNMSAAELRSALQTAQKTAQYRITQHQQYLSDFSRLPGNEPYMPFYTVKPYQPAGGGNAAQNAIDAELAKRAQQQRGGGMR